MKLGPVSISLINIPRFISVEFNYKYIPVHHFAGKVRTRQVGYYREMIMSKVMTNLSFLRVLYYC